MMCPVMTMNEITQRLYAAILEKGISYGELARLTGIPKSAIQRYATGTTGKIPLERLSLLAAALGSGREQLDFTYAAKLVEKEI